MVTFGERIRAMANALGKEEQDIAKDLGLNKSRMSHYITGRSKVPSDLLQLIVDTYKINPLFLFKENVPLYEVETKETVRNYTYIPTAISAGLPINVEGITEYEKIRLPDSVMGKWAGNQDVYILKINGDSMNNIMPDNSLIAVKPITIDGLKNGDIVLFSTNHEYSVKRFYKFDDVVVFRPDSDNLEFYETRININEIDNLEIHGKVVLYIVELD